MERLDWNHIESRLDAEGYVLLPGRLPREQAEQLIHHDSLLPDDIAHASRFHFGDVLPSPLATWRAAFYPRLAALANLWNAKLGIDYRYPATLDAFLQCNRETGQTRPLSHLNRLREGDHSPLAQGNEVERAFPLQVVALLNEPGKDFRGGEFVMTERRPRMQSRPMVVPLKAGDVAIICSMSRPLEGSRGYYRADLKHAISRVHEGVRIGLTLSFHD